MITVSIGGKDIQVKPKHLIDYVEKIDFIKSRRATPWSLIQGFPPKLDEENYKTLVGLAMKTVYSQSSSVSIEEELCFDKSDEGFLYSLWRCIPAQKTKGKPEDWKTGLNRVNAIWEKATSEEKMELKTALLATDESNNLGNSDGPSGEQSPPGTPAQ
jgi:hypothetical protein